jgi:hypothetical protein
MDSVAKFGVGADNPQDRHRPCPHTERPVLSVARNAPSQPDAVPPAAPPPDSRDPLNVSGGEIRRDCGVDRFCRQTSCGLLLLID